MIFPVRWYVNDECAPSSVTMRIDRFNLVLRSAAPRGGGETYHPSKHPGRDGSRSRCWVTGKNDEAIPYRHRQRRLAATEILPWLMPKANLSIRRSKNMPGPSGQYLPAERKINRTICRANSTSSCSRMRNR